MTLNILKDHVHDNPRVQLAWNYRDLPVHPRWTDPAYFDLVRRRVAALDAYDRERKKEAA